MPNTTYGITSGLSRNAERSALPRKRRRASAIDASVPRNTAPMLVSAAMTALVSSDERRSVLSMNSWYQCSVKPLSGNAGTAALLNEKMSRITIGAYRNAMTSTNSATRSRRPLRETATSIRPAPRSG